MICSVTLIAVEEIPTTVSWLEMHDVPDDVLCHIFLMTLAPDCQPDYRYVPGKQVLRKRLVSICLTCKHWHELAYNYASLWAGVIDFERDDAAYIAELLRRSGSVPLEIGGKSAFNPVEIWVRGEVQEVLRTIFQHKSRIKTINLITFNHSWAFICKNFLNHPAPNLEFLNLIPVSDVPFSPVCWFPALFGNCAPRLRRFNMERCMIDFSSPALHNLTSLAVSYIVHHDSTSASNAPTAGGWLDILQHIPSLEFLTLVDAITHSDSSGATKHTNVPLTSLRLLSLFGFLEESAVILKYLKIPSSCGIRLHCDDRHPFSLGHVILGTLVSQLSQTPDLPSHKQHLQAKLLSGHHIYFSNSRHIRKTWDLTEIDELARHAEESSAPLVWLILSFTNDFQLARQFLRQLLSVYEPTFSKTTEFILGIDEESHTMESDTTFISTVTNFEAFTTVTRLELYALSLYILLPSFTHSENPVFPSLQTLVLIGTRPGNQIDCDVVLQFLLFRACRNAPISRLLLINTTIDRERLSILREESKVEVICEGKS